MTTAATPSRVDGGEVAPLRAPTLGWALRRIALGILILVFTVTGAAYLLYASIEPVEDRLPDAVSSKPSGPPVGHVPVAADPSKPG